MKFLKKITYRPISDDLDLTPRQKWVLRRVEFWQQTLEPLGLQPWRTNVSFMDEPEGKDNALAACHTSEAYDTCTFQFAHDHVEDAEKYQLDETIVHEWLHVLFRDYNQSISSVYDQLAPAVAEQWDTQMNHELEGVIEKLARTICALHSE